MNVEQDPKLSSEMPKEATDHSAAASSYQQRRERGRVARRVVSRSTHGEWAPSPDRPDPVDLLEAQDSDRIPDLIPIRYSRMMASPFAFMRGSAIVMARDLASTPRTGIQAQLCGDAHLLNFGAYASPERALLFDLNDFDETLPGPWEWDVKRLAASFVVAGRENGFDAADCREAAQASVASYRQRMTDFSEMGELEVWYSRVSEDDVRRMISDAKARKRTAKKVNRTVRKAHGHDSLQALSKLTKIVDGRRTIIDDPPLLVRIPEGDEIRVQVNAILESYKRTLQEDRRHLLDRYRFVDTARKVVGVGSVGTRAYVVLLEGRDEDDPLFLQVKEAGPSILESYVESNTYEHHGHRVVAGQRLMQAASDIFLRWFRGTGGRDFYWRQLKDMKGSANVKGMSPDELVIYAGLCGWTLARAHAPATACRSPATSARASASTGRSPTLRKPMPTRPNGTTPPSVRPCSRAGSRPRRAPEKTSRRRDPAGANSLSTDSPSCCEEAFFKRRLWNGPWKANPSTRRSFRRHRDFREAWEEPCEYSQQPTLSKAFGYSSLAGFA